MLAILVILFNVLLLLFSLVMAAALPPTVIFAVAPIMNILAAISYRKGRPIKWKKLTIAANVFFGLIALVAMFLEENNLKMLGFFMLASTLCSLLLVKKHKTERQPAEPEKSQSFENHETKTDPAAENQLPPRYQSNAFAGEMKKAGFLEDLFLWLGLGGVFIGFMVLSDELEDKTLMEVGALPFLLLSGGVISLVLWNYFRLQKNKINYAQRLASLGMDKGTSTIKAAQDISAGQRVEGEYLWSQFIADNRREIERLDQDIKAILKEQYQIDSTVVPDIEQEVGCSPSVYYLNRTPAADAAKQIRDVIFLHEGGSGSFAVDHTGIRPISPEAPLEIRPSSPGGMLIVWGSLALAVYGMAAIFIGPAAEIFIPSDLWYQVGVFSTLALIALVFYQTYQANRTSDGPGKRPKPKPLHLFVVIPLLIWGTLYFALIHGAGEIYTEAFGTTERKIITAQKDEDTRQSYGGRMRKSVTAYCVTSDQFRWFAEIYCIDEAHYQALPEGSIPFYFSVKSSALGYVIKGYNFYENIPEDGFAPGELEYIAAVENLKADRTEDGNRYLQSAAEKGHVEAQFINASRYLNQDPPDYATARKWLERASEKGHDEAPFILGLMYRDGDDVAPSLAVAAKWFRLSAERGYPRAQYIYSLSLAQGYGVEQDLTETLVWLRKAAENGDYDAQHLLGMAYAKGEFGVEQNGPQALKWLRMAAQQGHVASQHDLGVVYAHGEVVPKDLIESYAWLSNASGRQHERTEEALADVRSRLSNEMLAKARARAAAYKRDYPVKRE